MFSKKKIEKNRGKYMLISFLIFLAIVYFGFNIYQTWDKYQESKRRLIASQESFDSLQKQYEKIQALQKLEQSSTGYEMHIRSKFDLVKEGEKTVFISNEIIPEPEPEEKGIQKLFNTFKDFFN